MAYAIFFSRQGAPGASAGARRVRICWGGYGHPTSKRGNFRKYTFLGRIGGLSSVLGIPWDTVGFQYGRICLGEGPATESQSSVAVFSVDISNLLDVYDIFRYLGIPMESVSLVALPDRPYLSAGRLRMSEVQTLYRPEIRRMQGGLCYI